MININRQYDYKPLDRITNDDGTRFYSDPITNSPLVSVTTILSSTADKTFLLEWAARVGQKKADAIRDEASALGTLMHTHLECHIQDIARPKGHNLIRQMASRMADVVIRDGMKDVDEVLGYEVPLYYPDLFAGTSDLIGVYKGKQAILDHKTTKKMKTEERLHDYYSQLTAYSLCHNAVYGTNIRTGVIFMVARDLEYKTFVLEGEQFDKHERDFLTRLERYLAS